MEITRSDAELIYAVFNTPNISFPGTLIERVFGLKNRCREFLDSPEAEPLVEDTEVNCQ